MIVIYEMFYVLNSGLLLYGQNLTGIEIGTIPPFGRGIGGLINSLLALISTCQGNIGVTRVKDGGIV